jgi:hypothetical protein
MVISIDSSNIAKYERIYTIRQSDGVKIVAERKVFDEQTSIRWKIEVLDKSKRTIYNEFPFPVKAGTDELYYYDTRELLAVAQKRGFGDWYELP